MKRLPGILCVIAACVFGSGVVQAVVLPPGGSGPPDIFNPLPGATLFASITGPFNSGLIMGTYTAAVFSDPNNPFGAGDLDFVYQVANSASSQDAIIRLTAINFTGFLTDVGYTATGSAIPGGLFVNGTTSPVSVDRSFGGDTVGFQMGMAPNGILPGATSVALLIETNATAFHAGNLNMIDGGTTTVAAFAPVPEPAAGTLLLLGITTVFGIKRLLRRPA